MISSSVLSQASTIEEVSGTAFIFKCEVILAQNGIHSSRMRKLQSVVHFVVVSAIAKNACVNLGRLRFALM
ncbi:hypothetical protein AQUCO_04300085v1 [Aquilegia coerulea]|uniref:Uncharacterized protein n=1 Tax=Aquilegia coerulea TaxID=218851 RepID=A0A2G5CNP4_AQUCA|nr:hypothetical protein AQUCO_04300085v1 [Aquilegia coerulea]